MFDGAKLADVLPGSTWDQYLLLLGGPFAAAVLAKGIVTYKLSAGTLQKSDPPATSPTQVVTDDGGSADLVDSQYLIFNVIALGYYVVQLASTSVLPIIPSPLLVMTSAAAGIFVANKAAQKNAPTITSVSPATVEPGDSVTVLGANFDPAENGDPSRRISVALSGVTRTIYSTDTSDTHVRFIVPADTSAGHQTVVVTSTAGVETEAHDLEVGSNAVVVTGIDGAGGLRPGTIATLVGQHLGQPGDSVRVTVGATPAPGAPNAEGTRLSFAVPAALAASTDTTADVKVALPGQGEVAVTLPIERPLIRSAWRTGDPSIIAVAATGWHGPDLATARAPQVLVNGRPAGLDPAWRGVPDAPFRATLPPEVAPAGELRIAVIDDLGRRSPDLVLA